MYGSPQCSAVPLLTKELQIYSVFLRVKQNRNATQPTNANNMLLAMMLIELPLAPES